MGMAKSKSKSKSNKKSKKQIKKEIIESDSEGESIESQSEEEGEVALPEPEEIKPAHQVLLEGLKDSVVQFNTLYKKIKMDITKLEKECKKLSKPKKQKNLEKNLNQVSMLK